MTKCLPQPRHNMRMSDSVRAMINQDGGILLEINHGQMFSLNLVGSRILEMLQRGYVESQIADAISREFGVNQDVALADVQELLESLRKNHLLQFNGSNGCL